MTRLLGMLLCLALAGSAQAQVPLGTDPRAALDQARSDEQGVLDQLNDIDRQLDQVRTELRDLQARMDEVDDRRRRHEDEAAVAQAQLDLLAGQVKEQLSALYRLQRRGLARIVFSAGDPSELRRTARYLQSIVEADTLRLREFMAAMAKKGEAVAAADRDLGALEALRTELRLKEAELRDQRARRVDLLDEIRSRRELAFRALRESGAASAALSSQLSQAGTASSSSGTSSTSGSTGAGPFRGAFGKLPWPVRGTLIRRFGPYTDPLTGEAANSTGIDISADYGTPIRAVHDGVVRLVNFVPRYGQTVVLSHGDYSTVYAHCNGVLVRRGQQVSADEVIALVGNSGLVEGSGYVLTFEIRYHDSHQDPLTWLQPL